MRKSAGSALIPLVLLSFLLILGLSGCSSGGGSQEDPRVLTEVTVSPASVSLSRGQVVAVSAIALDQEDDTILADFTFSSSSNAVFTVSEVGPTLNSRLVCAGTWDSLTTPVVCTPAAAPGTANLTVTATAGGVSVTSDPVPVFVHEVVANIVVTPAAVDLANCVSQDINLQFTAQAFDGLGNDITPSVGPFTWSSSFVTVATITDAGVATGELPGVSNITASVGSSSAVISPAAPLTICPPASLSLHVNASTATSFSVAVSGTQTLAIDVVDTKGEPLESVPVAYQITNPNVAAIASATRVVTGSAVGVTGIFAHCTPPSCNTGSTIPTYSNVVMATVTGTAGAGRVYATCTSAAAPCTTPATGGGTQTPLIPIDTSNDTAGTALNLPHTPNSMVFTRDGAVLFLGSANGMMVVDAVANAVSGTVNNMPGRVLTVSPDGNRVVVSNIAGASVFILDRAANSIQVLGVSNATAAAFTPDGLRLFIVAANTLFVASPVFALQNVPLTAVANDVTVLPGGSFAFLAGGAASSITAFATCEINSSSTPVESYATTATPPLIASLPDGRRVVAANSPNLDVVTVTPAFTGCPSSPGGVLTSVDFGQGAFTPQQIIVLPDASRVYVTSNLTSLLAYEVASGTPSAIPLIGGAAPTTGGATVNGSRVYVGGTNNAVHRIDVATATDATIINLTFTPDLVGVRPR